MANRPGTAGMRDMDSPYSSAQPPPSNETPQGQYNESFGQRPKPILRTKQENNTRPTFGSPYTKLDTEGVHVPSHQEEEKYYPGVGAENRKASRPASAGGRPGHQSPPKGKKVRLTEAEKAQRKLLEMELERNLRGTSIDYRRSIYEYEKHVKRLGKVYANPSMLDTKPVKPNALAIHRDRVRDQMTPNWRDKGPHVAQHGRPWERSFVQDAALLSEDERRRAGVAHAVDRPLPKKIIVPEMGRTASPSAAAGQRDAFGVGADGGKKRPSQQRARPQSANPRMSRSGGGGVGAAPKGTFAATAGPQYHGATRATYGGVAGGVEAMPPQFDPSLDSSGGRPWTVDRGSNDGEGYGQANVPFAQPGTSAGGGGGKGGGRGDGRPPRQPQQQPARAAGAASNAVRDARRTNGHPDGAPASAADFAAANRSLDDDGSGGGGENQGGPNAAVMGSGAPSDLLPPAAAAAYGGLVAALAGLDVLARVQVLERCAMDAELLSRAYPASGPGGGEREQPPRASR